MSLVTRQKRSRMGIPTPQTMNSYTFPASVGGINALQSLISMPPEDCIFCHNLVPSEYGLRLREGYREYGNGYGGKPVRSLIPYEGQDKSQSQDRLFAVTEDGIYNATTDGDTSPSLVQAFATQSDDAGFGVWTEFTNAANERFLQYADEENGLFEYEEATGLWSVPTITGPVVADIVFVTTWKNRLWYVEASSGQAWYLAPNSKSGVATVFTFGSKFEHGGDVRGLWNWTLDGGNGADDYLVCISRGGDVLMYQGVDPDDATNFSLVGSFYIGELPESRRVVSSYGGELYMLSTFGIISARDLLQGVDVTTPGKSPSAKINRGLRDDVAAGKDSHNWALVQYPSDGFMLVVQPFDTSNSKNAMQYMQNLLTQAWGRWRNVPAVCVASWSGSLMIGSPDGRVYIYEGLTDGALLDSSFEGSTTEFDILTSFQPPGGEHSTFKRAGIIRPIILENGDISLNIAAIYDYDIFAQLTAPPSASTVGGATWDNSIWDQAVWDYQTQTIDPPTGALGLGRTVAVAMRGNAHTRFTLVGWDISYTQGGFL